MIDALERLHEQLEQLAASLDRTWREKEALKTELATSRARHELERERERTRSERVVHEARAEAARIVAEGEEEAARVRAEAGRSVAATSSRLENLLRVRESVLGELRGILQAYGSVLDQIEQGRPLAALLAEEAGELAPTTPEPEPFEPVRGTGDLFPRRVELDAGPFADFAELSAFERSLARLPKVDDVYVRRFGDDRAEIELSLTEERPLVYDLTTHLPYRLVVTPADGRLHVDVEVGAAAGTGT